VTEAIIAYVVANVLDVVSTNNRVGIAKPKGDDIVRSKTVAKVTSTHVSHTYPDGSYAVPYVVMAS